MTTFNNLIKDAASRVNRDPKTGIRYGVINANDLAEWAWEEIESNGKDLDYADAKENLLNELSSAINGVLSEYSRNFDAKALASEIIDDLDIEIESTGDVTRYSYEKDGLQFNVCSDGDIIITKSDFIAYRGLCSPCNPNACHLTTEGPYEAYCLGPDWFDERNPIPYAIAGAGDHQHLFFRETLAD